MEPTSNKGPTPNRKPRGKPSGDEYLAQQISEARAALESTLDDLKLDVVRAADLRRWVRRYPWAALGTAFVAGFTLPLIARAARRRAATDDAEQPTPDSAEAPSTQQSHKSARSTAMGTSWQSALLSGLFDILRLAVTQLISAGVRQAASGRTAFHSTAPSDERDPSPHPGAGQTDAEAVAPSDAMSPDARHPADS